MKKTLSPFKIICLFFSFALFLFLNIQCGGSESAQGPNPLPPPGQIPPPDPCTELAEPEACAPTLEGMICNFNFDRSKQGWEGGFADYPVSREQLLDLESIYTLLPESNFISTRSCSMKISGRNGHDDLFMYLKKKISNLEPRQNYQLTFNIELASNYPNDVTGLDNRCGNSLTPICLKAGATKQEPKAEIGMHLGEPYYQMNLDKGNQQSGGRDMQTMGDIVVNLPVRELCDRSNLNCEFKLIQRSNLNNIFSIQSNENGEIWVIVGTDSGTNSSSIETFYYNNINITFQKQ